MYIAGPGARTFHAESETCLALTLSYYYETRPSSTPTLYTAAAHRGGNLIGVNLTLTCRGARALNGPGAHLRACRACKYACVHLSLCVRDPKLIPTSLWGSLGVFVMRDAAVQTRPDKRIYYINRAPR